MLNIFLSNYFFAEKWKEWPKKFTLKRIEFFYWVHKKLRKILSLQWNTDKVCVPCYDSAFNLFQSKLAYLEISIAL